LPARRASWLAVRSACVIVRSHRRIYLEFAGEAQKDIALELLDRHLEELEFLRSIRAAARAV
jgi:hypothetical protein